MEQTNLFADEGHSDKKYEKKTTVFEYVPSAVKPHILELLDASKAARLRSQVAQAHEQGLISEEEKTFLLAAAARHTVFNYGKIADYYAHASKEMQQLMERSALVFVDFHRAIELGFVKLSDEIREQYLQDYNNAQ